MTRRTVLNTGSGPSDSLPPHYDEFDCVRLDIDTANSPDIVADVRDLSALAESHFDAAYLSHLLEHFGLWDVPTVLAQLRRVIKPGGFIEVRVPHAEAMFRAVLEGHPIDAPLYDSAMGPITALDILYGQADTVCDGNVFMMHKTAFTPELLGRCFEQANLKIELLQTTGGTRYELCAIGRKVEVPAPVLN